MSKGKWPFHYDAGGYFVPLQPERYYAFGGSGDVSSESWESYALAFADLLGKHDAVDIGATPEALSELPYTILSGQEYVDYILSLEPSGDLGSYGHWSE